MPSATGTGKHHRLNSVESYRLRGYSRPRLKKQTFNESQEFPGLRLNQRWLGYLRLGQRQYRNRVLRICSRAGSGKGLANLKGALKNRTDGKDAAQPVRTDGSQTHGREATAGLTVRASAELARSDRRPKVRRYGLSSLCENTILRAAGGRGKLFDYNRRHIKFRILFA